MWFRISLIAIEAGCVHVHGTTNGYGERAGYADLISIIPALELRAAMHFLLWLGAWLPRFELQTCVLSS